METILHEKSTSDVPNDIIKNILVRVPVKSLLRFQAVSRTWEATISDSVFARTHLTQSKSSLSKYILIEEKKPAHKMFETFMLVQIKNQELQVESLLNNPDEIGCAWFMSYLDGLLLFQCRTYIYPSCAKFTLWNPSTATFIKFKCPSSLGNNPRFYGLCYDPLIEDYKIVMSDGSQYVIFYCRNKRWTKQKKTLINGISFGTRGEGVYFNGSLYWVREKFLLYCYHPCNYEIVCYDSRDDKFKKVDKPMGKQFGRNSPQLVLLRGHLCLYYSSFYRLLIMKKDDDRDSWTVFIDLDYELPTMSCPEPLFMPNESEIIIKSLDFSECFISCNLSKKTYVKIKNSDYARSIMFPFVESTLVLDMGHCRRFGRRRANEACEACEAYEELREVFFLILG